MKLTFSFVAILRCINRNIVECKWSSFYDHRTGIRVLIETLWNVNSLEYHWLYMYTVRINRNIVECKSMVS